ncbi:OmpH family outer membrane protein [Sediminispirochaeta smaragdinae]|uniref:Outer membrane chaperone Skp (OmpH) n=1 Tax=Sediminispirochaeta smaragdinae (strain DSM 11293 / JCM 15392 / SEBR 4228) TaxID=573413 RepID=E1R1K4_SEDSS|nr:OmpH family outer membrane protein [Sediminispirochaeta smaragdinae]ADK81145.1 outer membrane chaperone Skp (OmpH) [Sediminispirochaeta smaragdinae DSM 11293]
MVNYIKGRTQKAVFLITLMVMALWGGTSALLAEKLTMVAVVDLTKIVSDYFKESTEWREIDELTKKMEETVRQRMDEINALKQQKIEAENANDDLLVLKLEEQIRKKQEYLQEYNKIMSDRIQSKKENLLTSSDFSREIIKTVQYIAESEGYSIVFRKKDPNILYYNYEVDITNKVLDHLRRTAGSR